MRIAPTFAPAVLAPLTLAAGCESHQGGGRAPAPAPAPLPPRAAGPVTSLTCAYVEDVTLEDGKFAGSVAQLRGLNAAGEVVWRATGFVNYPARGPGLYRTAILNKKALLHVPLGPDHHYYATDLENGGVAAEIGGSDPAIGQAAWTSTRTMDQETKPTEGPQGTGGR